MSGKPIEVYRKFWTETAAYSFPPRFGYDWFCAAIDKQWSSNGILTDWLGLESILRDILSSRALDDTQRVALCRDAVAAFTRRGPIEVQPE